MAQGTTLPDRGGFDLFGFLARFAPLIFLVVLMAGFAIAEPRFLSTVNLLNVLRQVSIYGLLAIGMTFVILTAGIDLSIGSMLAFCGLAAAIVAKGSATGNFSLGATRRRLGLGRRRPGRRSCSAWPAARCRASPSPGSRCRPSWSRWAACRSSAAPRCCCPAAGRSAASTRISATGARARSSEIPVPVLVFLGFAVLAHLVLRYSRFGRQVYAVGGNPEAARLSGLKVRRVLLSVYVIMGFFVGLGAFVLSARLNSAEAVAGMGYELTVIASVVIGGTSLFGGIGTIFGTVIGTVLIGVLLNGLVLMNVSSYIQQIIIGVIIVLAVAFDTFAKSRRRRA